MNNKLDKAIDILMKQNDLYWCEFCNEWVEYNHRKDKHNIGEDYINARC